MSRCYLCGSTEEITRDHFIPDSQFRRYHVNGYNIILPCCRKHNGMKANSSVFPPFSKNCWLIDVSWYTVIQMNICFNNYVRAMIKFYPNNPLPPLFYEWLDDYRRFVINGFKPIDSKFNKKMYVIKINRKETKTRSN